MNKLFLKLLIFTLIFTFSATNYFAQEKVQPEEFREQNDNPTRGDLLKELGLTKEQFQQIRIVNSERKPLMQEAQRRLREANRNLDQAVYADQIDDQTIQLRLKQVQEAQAEVQRIRANTELEVRKILTPEQLVIFRELRERFIKRLQTNQQRRQNRRNKMENPPNTDENRNFPKRRLNNRPKS